MGIPPSTSPPPNTSGDRVLSPRDRQQRCLITLHLPSTTKDATILKALSPLPWQTIFLPWHAWTDIKVLLTGGRFSFHTLGRTPFLDSARFALLLACLLTSLRTTSTLFLDVYVQQAYIQSIGIFLEWYLLVPSGEPISLPFTIINSIYSDCIDTSTSTMCHRVVCITE